MKKAFTLVELIVVITILAILGTIGFISLQGYSMQARDTKRVSDVSSLSSKINIELIRGTSLSELIEIGSGHIASGSILGVINNNITTFGKINFNNLRETRSSFLDPSTKDDYKGAYAIGMGSGGLRYNFFEIGTISEKEGKNKIVGNYYRLEEEDIPSLFLSGSIKYKNNGEELIYEINNKQSNETEEEIPEEPEIITIEVYGDEDLEAITACNKWVEDNVGTQGGGAENWLWVPARHFTTDGYGIGMDDEYYKREITHNNIKYICNGFAVAKYEMSYSDDITTPNSELGNEDWNTIKYEGTESNGGIVSRENRYTIADITQGQAIESCQSIGINVGGKTGLDFHLITNNEWMTIARNIELKGNNWSGGGIGSGFISNGVSNNTTLGCAGLISGKWATKTGPGYCNEKRQLILSNNQVIWDLSGNVREYVNKANTIDGSNHNSSEFRIGKTCGESIQWYSFLGGDGYTGCAYLNDYTRENIGPFNSGFNADNGMGLIYSITSETSNVFMRGGHADPGKRSGIYTLSLPSSIGGASVSFRCTL